MGLEPAAVIDVLTTRRIEAPGVVIRKPVPPDAVRRLVRLDCFEPTS